MMRVRTMKKRRWLFLVSVFAVLLLTILSGCDKESTSAADTYIDMAQAFIDQKDYDSAVEVLQKGLDVTNDEKIAKMLTDTIEKQVEQITGKETSSSGNQDGTGYTGTWAEGEIFWIYGGLILDIAESDGNMTIECTYTQAAPDSRVANFSENIALSEIKNDTVTVEFEDDGWGNAGTLVLEFCGSEIHCEIKDTYYAGDEAFAIWGITEGQYYLYRNDDAHEMMTYNIEEYYEMFPENNPDNWVEQTPTYDTSTASGILASLGMTEEEFRASCQPLCVLSSNSYLDIEDLRDYPSAYLGSMYYFTSDVLKQYYGEPLQEKVQTKGMTNDGYMCYIIEKNCIIFDYRDDIYSPTISEGDSIIFYMIFSGVQTVNGIDYDCFKLISLDK